MRHQRSLAPNEHVQCNITNTLADVLRQKLKAFGGWLWASHTSEQDQGKVYAQKIQNQKLRRAKEPSNEFKLLSSCVVLTLQPIGFTRRSVMNNSSMYEWVSELKLRRRILQWNLRWVFGLVDMAPVRWQNQYCQTRQTQLFSHISLHLSICFDFCVDPTFQPQTTCSTLCVSTLTPPKESTINNLYS